MKTKAVIYARVSTDQQSTDSQINDLQIWAENNNFDVVEKFDEPISGFIQDRDELNKLKIYIKEHNIKQVICYELSRLGRSTRQILNEINDFSKDKVNIYFKKENLNTLSKSATDTLLLTLISGIAELEATTIKERTGRGRMNSALKGKRVGFTKMPLGYDADENGFIIIHNEDADLVRSMYKAIASGISAPRLAKDLNAKGVPTFNDKVGKSKVIRNGDVVPSKWNPKTIKNIIKSTRYKGIRDFGGKSFSVPRIVDDEIWDEANQKINDHTGYLSRTKYDYLFKSKITCGQCGYTLKSLRKYSKKLGDKKFKDVLYYTCQSYLHTGQNCDCGRFRSEVFDKYLYEVIFESIPRSITTAFNKENAATEKAELSKKLEYWMKEKDSFIKEQGRIKTLFIKGIIDEDEMDANYGKLISKVNEADYEISRLEKIMKQLTEPKNFEIDVFKKYYWNADFATKREFVEEHIQRIKVFKVDEVTFDLSKIKWTEVAIGNSGSTFKTPKTISFNNPKRNEVIWFVELWAFDDPQPHTILMTSASGTNYLNYNLKFDKETRIVSI